VRNADCKAPHLVSPDQAIDAARSRTARLIAIDGFPCSGKSTLASKFSAELGFQVLPLDDFLLPISDWRSDISPGFPFPFCRYEAFLTAVESLARSGSCGYLPFDWEKMQLSDGHRVVHLDAAPVAVEGTSSLHPRLAPLYSLRLFVESRETTVLTAVLSRDGHYFEAEWRNLWLPSVDIYMKTNPRARADLLVQGRGIIE